MYAHTTQFTISNNHFRKYTLSTSVVCSHLSFRIQFQCQAHVACQIHVSAVSRSYFIVCSYRESWKQFIASISLAICRIGDRLLKYSSVHINYSNIGDELPRSETMNESEENAEDKTKMCNKSINKHVLTSTLAIHWIDFSRRMFLCSFI